jgi:hypothetical protein
MHLPKECVEEFADIFENEFNIRLSKPMAESKARNLLKLSEKLIYIKTNLNKELK